MILNVKHIPFEFDGTIDNKAWALTNSEPLKPNRNQDRVTEQTNFKALVSDKNLYLKFTCEDSFLKANYKNLNDPLFDEDVVEIFIGDMKEPNKYLELEFNTNNAIFSAMIINNNLNLSREYLDGLGIKVQSQVLENSFCITAIVKIDELQKLGVFKFDEELAFGAYRINLMEDGSFEFSALSPTLAEKPDFAFHVYQNFGRIIFKSK